MDTNIKHFSEEDFRIMLNRITKNGQKFRNFSDLLSSYNLYIPIISLVHDVLNEKQQTEENIDTEYEELHSKRIS